MYLLDIYFEGRYTLDMKSRRTHATLTADQIGTVEWFEPITKTDKYEIASRVTLAGLEGFKGTMSADQQRKVFGRYVFGKMLMEISTVDGGTVKGYRKVCFGTDWEDYTLTFDEIAEIVNNPDKPYSIAGRTFGRNRKTGRIGRS
jgi:hypothetical protein